MLSQDAMMDLSERLQGMRRQETTSYKCVDYLSPEWQLRFMQNENPQCPGGSASSSAISEMWREKICEWSYQVVDHFDFNREIVSVAMSYLDRYLATRTVNKKIFQLAAMTALYIAIKLYEPGQLRMSSLIDLSRGYFLVDHIASMEDSMLQALGWHVHPPTPFSFSQDLIHLIPHEISPQIRHDVNELSRFLTELSVCDYFFVTKKPSSVALAAMINAIELQGSHTIRPQIKAQFLQKTIEVGLDTARDEEVIICYERLREMYIAGGYAPNLEVEGEEPSQRLDTVSPVSVLDTPDVEGASYDCPPMMSQ